MLKNNATYLWAVNARIRWESWAFVVVIANGLDGGLTGKSGTFHLLSRACAILLRLVSVLRSNRSPVLTRQVGGRSLSFEQRFGGWRKRLLFLTFQQQTQVVVYLEMNKNKMWKKGQYRQIWYRLFCSIGMWQLVQNVYNQQTFVKIKMCNLVVSWRCSQWCSSISIINEEGDPGKQR